MKYKALKYLAILNFVLILLIVTTVGVVKGAGDYAYYRPVVIESDYVEAPGTDGSLTDYPVAIIGTYSELATTGNGGNIENTVSTGGASGSLTVPADFDVGSNNTCTNSYSYEFESYTDTTGSIVLWVKIPELTESTDVTFYLCYGDSGQTTSNEDVNGTWNTGYAGVWHLAETSGTFYDSTSGISHGTDYVSDTEKTGVLGSGQGFDGSDDYIQVAESIGGPLDDLDSIHISVWLNPDTLTDEMALDRYMGSSNDLQLWVNSQIIWRSASEWSVNEPISADTWTFINANFDGTYARLWVNDGTVDSLGETDQATSNNEDWWIGMDTDSAGGGSPGNYYDGTMDEIRISNINRSKEWADTDYNNVNEASFLSVGAEEEAETPTETPTPTSTPTPPAILMGDASVEIPEGLNDALETALGNYRPDSELGLDNEDMANMWAVTAFDETTETDYYWVSLAGMVVEDTEDLDGWSIMYSLWDGIALAYDNGDTTYTAHVYGSVGYENMLATAELSDISFPDVGGSGSANYFFPWPPGYVAFYGMKGVHEDVGPVGSGYGGMGWRAVDWVGGSTYADNIYPNSVYVVESGTVSWRCEDSIQTWVQIGNFLYGHLTYNETLESGIYHSQGSYLGSLIYGSHHTNCGVTDQRPTSYHLHIGFLPTGDYFQWEDWVLDINDQNFRRGNSVIGPGNYMLSEWSGASRPIIPTPGPTVTPGGPTVTPSSYGVDPGGYDSGGGGSFWDGLISSMRYIAQERVDQLNDPNYQPPNLPNEVTLPIMLMSGIRVVIRSLYVLVKSNLNMTISLIVISLIIVLETIRIIRAIWMGIKDTIPFF